MTSPPVPPSKKTGSQSLMNREEDASPAAAAFSSVSGVLGGFSMTLVVLALSPQVISSDISKDWIVATILLSAGLYIYASSIFANAMSFEDRAVKYHVFNSALKSFHIANLLSSLGLLLLTVQFQLLMARIAAGSIALLAFRVAIINILPSSQAGNDIIALCSLSGMKIKRRAIIQSMEFHLKKQKLFLMIFSMLTSMIQITLRMRSDTSLLENQVEDDC